MMSHLFSRHIKSTIISMLTTSKRTLVFPPATSYGHALPFSTALVTCSSWCPSRRLQLNATKTELIWFGSRQMLQRLSDHDLTLEVGISVMQPVRCVRDPSVHLDSELTMKTHISKVDSACFYQLRKIRQVRRVVGQDITQQLVSAFVLSRLDYYNLLLVFNDQPFNRSNVL